MRWIELPNHRVLFFPFHLLVFFLPYLLESFCAHFSITLIYNSFCVFVSFSSFICCAAVAMPKIPTFNYLPEAFLSIEQPHFKRFRIFLFITCKTSWFTELFFHSYLCRCDSQENLKLFGFCSVLKFWSTSARLVPVPIRILMINSLRFWMLSTLFVTVF